MKNGRRKFPDGIWDGDVFDSTIGNLILLNFYTTKVLDVLKACVLLEENKSLNIGYFLKLESHLLFKGVYN